MRPLLDLVYRLIELLSHVSGMLYGTRHDVLGAILDCVTDVLIQGETQGDCLTHMPSSQARTLLGVAVRALGAVLTMTGYGR